MSRAQLTGVVYGVVFAVWLFGLELPARFGLLPILTLSGDVRAAIRWWHLLGLELAALLVVLFGHLDQGWRVRWLLVAAAVFAVSIVIHALRP